MTEIYTYPLILYVVYGTDGTSAAAYLQMLIISPTVDNKRTS